MEAEPEATQVTRPLSSTVAAAVLSLTHCRGSAVPLPAQVTSGVSWTGLPSVRDTPGSGTWMSQAYFTWAGSSGLRVKTLVVMLLSSSLVMTSITWTGWVGSAGTTLLRVRPSTVSEGMMGYS